MQHTFHFCGLRFAGCGKNRQVVFFAILRYVGFFLPKIFNPKSNESMEER